MYQSVLDHLQQWACVPNRSVGIPWRTKPYIVRAYLDATHLVECWHLSKQEAWKLAQLYIGQRWSVIVKDNAGKVVFKSSGGAV
jgi:hypothetical protein